MFRCKLVATTLSCWLALSVTAFAAQVPIDVIYTGNEGGITGSYLALEEVDLFAGLPDWELSDVALHLPAYRQGPYTLMDPDGRLTKGRFQAFFTKRPLRIGAPATAAYGQSSYGHFLQWPPSRESWVMAALLAANGEPPHFPDLDQHWATVRPVVNADGDRLWLVRDEGWRRPATPPPDFQSELWATGVDRPMAASDAVAASLAAPASDAATASDRSAAASDGPAGAHAIAPRPVDLDLSDAYRWEPLLGVQGRLKHNKQEARLIMLARQLGTWDRRIGMLRRMVADRPKSLLVGIGNTLDRPRSAASDAARKESWETIKTLPYAAFLPSQAELRLPKSQLSRFSRDVPLVAANVLAPDPEIILPPYRIIETQGTRVGIVGVVDREGLRDAGVAKLDAGWKVEEPVAAAKKAVAELRRQGIGTIIVITDMSHAALELLETKLTDVSLIVGGAKLVATDQSFTETVRYDWPAEARHPIAPLTVCPRPYRVGRVRLLLDRDYRHTYLLSVNHEARRIGDDQPGDPRLGWHVVDLHDDVEKNLDYVMLPDVRTLGGGATMESGDMMKWRMYSGAQWTRMAAGIVRERLGVEVVLLPKLAMFTNVVGQIPAYMVAGWLAGDDRLYRTELTGTQLQQLTDLDASFHTIVGAGYDPAVAKVGGRSLTGNERYVAIVSDRLLDNARFAAVFDPLRKAARPIGDLRPLVLGVLEGQRLKTPGYPDSAQARFSRWLNDDGSALEPRWAISLEDVGADALSIQNVNQTPYSQVRNARINTQNNAAVGGSGKLALNYSSEAVSWTSRIKALYRQIGFVDKVQETADDLVFSSELRLTLWRLPFENGAVQLTPYLLASYDTEFSPSTNATTNMANALQQDFDGIAGLVVSPGGAWSDIKLGVIGRYDLQAKLFRPGLQLATGFERALSNQFPIKVKVGADLRYYMTVGTPTPDQLGFLGDLSAALIVPIWQNLNLTLGLTGLVYRGQAAPQDSWGLSVNPTIGLSYGGVWKPQWGVLY